LLQQLDNEYGDAELIPIVWDTDDQFGDPRYSWYPGNGYVPWIIFGGTIEPTWNSYASYVSAYNSIHAQESPLDIQLHMDLDGSDLVLTADIEVTGAFDVTQPKVWFAVTHYREDSNADYVNAVEDYSGETVFELSEIGETGTYTHTFNFHDNWAIPEMQAVCVVQSWTGTKQILQAAQTVFAPNASISGTVTDEFSGDPLEGAVVSVMGSYETETGGDGTYTLDLFAGTFDVLCDYPGYQTGVIENLTVLEGESLEGIDFILVEGLPVPVYLQADLTDVITLNWQPPGAVALDEGFESDAWPPEGWEEYQLNQAGGWEHSTGGYNSDFCAHHDDIYGVTSEDWLVSPQVPVGGIMTFWEKNMYMSGYYDYHGVWVSTGSSNPEDGDFVEVAEYDGEAEDWLQRTLDLSSYDEPFYLAFKYVGNYATDWWLDDIYIGFPQSRELLGYNVYEAGDVEPLNGDTPVDGTSFLVGNPPSGTYTYTATGVYTSGESLPSNEVMVEWDSEGVNDVTPLTTELKGNYPNPFNPDTRINFSMREPSQVTIEVFNLAGQLVTTLVDDYRQAGEYTVSWNANNVTSGVYFYRMLTEDYSLTRKMTLIK